MTRNILHLKDMYVDLMVRVLTNSIYEDSQINPHLPEHYDRDRREVGGDWPKVAHTMVGAKRLHNLADLACKALDQKIPGDFIETGIWRGGCCILMRALLGVYGDVERRVYAADSFEGLPKPQDEVFAADAGDVHHTYQELAVSLDKVKENFARYGLLDEQTVFVKGFFSDTLPKLKGSQFALLRLDGDMYESTICALDNLYPMLSPGGYIIIDDFGAVPACAEAVNDYRGHHGIKEPMQTVDWTGVWWRKRT